MISMPHNQLEDGSSLQVRRVHRIGRHVLSLLQDGNKAHVEALCAWHANWQWLISLQRDKTCSDISTTLGLHQRE